MNFEFKKKFTFLASTILFIPTYAWSSNIREENKLLDEKVAILNANDEINRSFESLLFMYSRFRDSIMFGQ